MTLVINIFEKFVVFALLLMMMMAIFVSTVELGEILYVELMKPPVFMLNIDEMLEVFGFFLMVLIGLELLETVKTYLEEDRVHAEVVFLVALVAVSRKVIILDYKTMTSDMLFGMSALIVALGACYFLVRKALHPIHTKPKVVLDAAESS